MSRFCIAIVASCFVAMAMGAAAGSDREVFEGQLNCAMTGQEPAEPRSLSFCFKYNEEACCPPGGDAENMELFQTITDVGLACRLRGDIRSHPLAQLYCLNCDPNQPRYIRNTGFTTAASEEPAQRDSTILVCQEWAEQKIGDASQFDECGLLKSSPCLDGEGSPIPDRDPYMCGDDIIIPSSFYEDGLTMSQNIEIFLNLDELGTPNMAADYGFKVVPNRACNDTEADANTSPDCLMTTEQLNRNIARYRDTGFTGTFTNPELCFNASASLSASVLAMMALLIVKLLA
eukprot:TRINITY_DN5125_c0_g1_i3.p1 TRINITY_DN5125_c0_g1~~TRINITY_DN5125_c0_g1_i3.p1  ORF type:complete len:289 (+),score=59.47 TRINITY_DN5125_c0_g1_i3:169-1035(+)